MEPSKAPFQPLDPIDIAEIQLFVVRKLLRLVIVAQHSCSK